MSHQSAQPGWSKCYASCMAATAFFNVAISSLGRCSRIVTQEYVAPLPNEIEMHHDRVTMIYIVDSICYSLDMQKAASRDPRDNIITVTEILCCVQGLQFVPNVIVI